ncbi:hypothetical protein [Salipiger sp.]|uniref:hypothetical protein n=1 Tax=Salipiger sp. TaxID=2078585 RepID=UPI003A985C7F
MSEHDQHWRVSVEARAQRLTTLLARLLVFDIGSAEAAAEELGGFPEVQKIMAAIEADRSPLSDADLSADERANDILDPPAVTSAEAPEEGGWHWWAGVGDEWFTVGPCPTREAAIQDMMDDGTAEFLDTSEGHPVWTHSFHIAEARQDPLRLADWIGLETILERADEWLADSDRVLSENDDGPWFEATAAQAEDLQDRISRACDEWQAAHGLVFTSRTFSHQRNEEHVVVPTERAAKERADEQIHDPND